MNRKNGVTLIEILVAMGILILLVAILYSVFNLALRSWKKSDNMLQAAEIARVVLERMSREISSAIVKSGSNNFYCVGYDKSVPSGWRTNSIADEFYFIAPLRPDNPDGTDLCEVGYWLNSRGTTGTSDDSLMRFYVVNSGTPDFDFNFSTGSSDELATNITELEFIYYDRNGTKCLTWDSHSSNQAPARIWIRIRVEVGEGSAATNPDFYSGDFSTIVSFPQ